MVRLVSIDTNSKFDIFNNDQLNTPKIQQLYKKLSLSESQGMFLNHSLHSVHSELRIIQLNFQLRLFGITTIS